MADKPKHASEYKSEQVELVRATCLYVATKLGDMMDDLVIIEEDAELLLAVVLAARGGAQTEEAQDSIREPREHPERGEEEAVEEAKRLGAPDRRVVCDADGDRFRHKLAEQDV